MGATATRSVAPYATCSCRSTAVSGAVEFLLRKRMRHDMVRDPSPPLTA